MKSLHNNTVDAASKPLIACLPHCTSIKALRAIIASMRASGASYAEIGKLLHVKPATVHMIAMYGREPVNAEVRAVLGLPALIPAPACVTCGEVHTTKRCTRNDQPHVYTAWDAMPVSRVLWAIENREVWSE